jgi:type I restriction enzyme S subunit
MILVREGGGTGKAGLIQEGQVASLGQRVMQLRPDQEKVLPRFLLHQWLSPIIQQDRIAAGMKGSASPHLNISSLRTFPFLLPSKHRQEMVVRVLDDLLTKDAQLQSIRKRLDTEIDVLLSSILDHAFRGQL